MWDFLDAIQVSCMVQSIDGRRKSSVQTKDAISDNRRHGEVVKGISKVLPHIGIAIFTKTFVVKPVAVRVCC